MGFVSSNVRECTKVMKGWRVGMDAVKGMDGMAVMDIDLTLSSLRRAYGSGELTPRRLIARLVEACKQADRAIWLHLLDERELEPYLAKLDRLSAEDMLLYGVPFAIKDNIDLAGVPTTAACPDYAFTPERSAFVVRRLIETGAIPLGKTNMDQFATGLVGVRSPYGVCRNSFDPDYIAGGSSSGSALAVAQGLVSFALGTDTAGSGRVPAAFNNIVGLKPSRGLISASGVVPACQSLDCVSIFTLCAEDARTILQVAAAPDSDDPYSRETPRGQVVQVAAGVGAECGEHAEYVEHPDQVGRIGGAERFRFGVPSSEHLEFFGRSGYADCFAKSCNLLRQCGGEAVEIDFTPFLEAARLLYHGPWVAERYAAVGDFIEAHPEAVHPVTRKIISSGGDNSAADAFRAMHRLQALKKRADIILSQVDLLVTPTAGACYTLAEVEAEPIMLNTNLGYYTNFVNLLDYCALAVPTAFSGRMPFGVTLVGPAFSEELLFCIGGRLHAATGLSMGMGDREPPAWASETPGDSGCIPPSGPATCTTSPTIQSPTPEQTAPGADSRITFAVCGAHLRGLPLNTQLTGTGGRFLEETRTASCYRMYALAESAPPKPGLVRSDSGSALPVELWDLDAEAFGRFVAAIPHPLGMGKLELEDGRWVNGFIAEPCVAATGADITHYGGWRAFLERGSECRSVSIHPRI
jgi:allophanate hydrolase